MVVSGYHSDQDLVDISGGFGKFFWSGVGDRLKFNIGASRVMGVLGGFVVCDSTYCIVGVEFALCGRRRGG